jgi:PASTA domain
MTGRRLTIVVVVGSLLMLLPSAASAASLVYIKGGNVWLASANGSDQRQVTTGGDWSFPSQADDGTILATQGTELYRLSPTGKQLAPPIGTVFTNAPAGWLGPIDDSISPDGANQAYGGEILTSPIGPCLPLCSQSPDFITLWGSATHFSQPNQTLGQENYVDPAWIDNSHLLLTASTGVFNAEVATYTLGGGDNTAVGWFTDHGTSLLNDPAINGDKMAFIADVNSGILNEIRLYQLTGPPPEAAGDPVNLPVDECNLPLNFQSARVAFSPDGRSLAYGSPDGIYLLSLTGWPSCQGFTYKLLIPGGSSPYFSPANLPTGPTPGPSCTVPNLHAKTLQKARTSLAKHHCRLGRVKRKPTAGKPGRVLSQSPAAGRTLANGSSVSVTVSRRS